MRFQIRIITPDCVFIEQEVDELILPTRLGAIGVLDNHAPLLTAIDIRPMLFRRQTTWTPLALIGGFALIKKGSVLILVNDAVSTSSVEPLKAEKELAEETDRLRSAVNDKEKLEATFSFKRARARYQILQSNSGFFSKA